MGIFKKSVESFNPYKSVIQMAEVGIKLITRITQRITTKIRHQVPGGKSVKSINPCGSVIQTDEHGDEIKVESEVGKGLSSELKYRQKLNKWI